MFSLPSQLLIATNNKGKFFEIESLLNQINIKAVPTFQFNIEEPEETGKTFAENSLLKARYYALKTGLTALADDSGLCVDAMNGEPGIYSARFAKNDRGENDFNFAFEKISAAIKNDNFAAHFICNLAIFDPKTNFEISFEGRVDGKLTFPPRGNKGFGYDPIFIKNGMNQTFGEIDPKQKDQISHRADAFLKLVNWLKNPGL
ncbi:MAG: RdgB/HAM1 family non-canonical purine NTP pyrophosphatase [Pseudomonadota bacterium]